MLAALGLALLVSAIWLVLRQLGLPDTFTPASLAAWLNSQGLWGPVLLILLMIFAVVVGPVPTLPVSAASGLAFGVAGGTLVAVIGAAVGAMIAFLTSRLLARDYFRDRLGSHPVFARDASQQVLFWGVLLTRLVPLFSFALISYAAGLTAISAGRYLVATLLGMLPMSVVFAGFGQTLQLHPAWTAVAAGLLLAVMTLLPWYLQKRHGARLGQWMARRGGISGDDSD